MFNLGALIEKMLSFVSRKFHSLFSQCCQLSTSSILPSLPLLFFFEDYGVDERVGSCEDGLPEGDNGVPLFY